MSLPINFGAGPAAIPKSVLIKIQTELLNWQGTGLSILETGHRTPQFTQLGEQLEAKIRRILKVPNEFAVLFMPGGAQIQFAMMVMNLTRGFTKANYVETGHWSALALKEAQKYTQVHIAASSRPQHFTEIPDYTRWDIYRDAAFIHITDNETIGGLEFVELPNITHLPLVSDMSSNLFSRPVDFSRLGCLYACAQKNFGIAGMTLVIVRHDLLDRALPETPLVFNYAHQEKHHSLASTPPTFAWYVAHLIMDWLEAEGGVDEMQKRSQKKSSLLYDLLDQSKTYRNAIQKPFRSRMNVPFHLISPEKEDSFFKAAEKQGLYSLKGHRISGGVRASLYNAISMEDVKALAQFLDAFDNDLF